MTSRSGFAALGSLLALALTTACSPPQRERADVDDPQQFQASRSSESAAVNYTRGGVTVRLPNGCSPEDITPVSCRGLRSLRLAKVGPMDDLIKPGVYERDGMWVGLRLVEESFVYAEAGNEEVLIELLASASPSGS